MRRWPAAWQLWPWPLRWPWGSVPVPRRRPPRPNRLRAPSVTQGEGLTAHFIDVGQALSVLVECEGHYLLYDGGNVPDGELVVSYLQNLGVQKLDYVFCSHAHEDHVGGLAAVLAAFPADHVYSPVTDATTVCFQNFVKYAQQQGRQVEIPAVGTSWPLGSATVQLLGPVRAYEDTNDTSLVLRIDYGQTSYLLTGDMEAEAERDLVDGGAPLDVDVLQVGHHGSNTSTSYVFLNQVLPEIAVISCGQGNEYGHPHEEPLSRLRDAGAGTYRTDLMGTIRVISDGAGYTIASQQFAEDQQLNPTPAGAAPAGIHRQRQFPQVPSAQLLRTAGREEPDPLLLLRGGCWGRVHALRQLPGIRHA